MRRVTTGPGVHLADANPPSTGIDAAEFATSRRSRRRSFTAVIVVVATVATAAGVSMRSVALPAVPSSRIAALTPADGDVTVYEVTTGGGLTVLVQEHQWLNGLNALAALPDGVAAQVLAGFDLDELSDAKFWRITSRQLRDDLVGPPTVDLLALLDAGLVRLASYGGAFPTVYDPALVLIPADPSPGDSWVATGSALLEGTLAYSYRASILEIDAECVVVESDLDFRFGDVPFVDQVSTERWCQGLGLVEADAVFDQGGGPEPVDYALAPDPVAYVAGQIRVPAPAATATDPSQWTAQELTTTYREPFLGDLGVSGITGMAPVMSPGGVLIVAAANGSDLVAWRPESGVESIASEPDLAVEKWRAHPGGEPLAMAVLDDLVVVSTAGRRVVAYDLNGVRRWHIDTEDLVLGPPVRVATDTSDLVVVQDLGGAVSAVDVESGAVRWRDRTRTDSDLGPAVSGDLVIVADRSGDLVAIDASSGRRRWERRGVGIESLGVVGESIVVARVDEFVSAIDDRGVTVWETSTPTWRGRVDEVAGRPALVGSEDVVVFDPETGRVVWSVPVGAGADGWSGGLSVHEGDRICVRDGDGLEIGCWSDDRTGIDRQVYLVASDEGVWRVDSDLAILRVSATSPETSSLGSGS